MKLEWKQFIAHKFRGLPITGLIDYWNIWLAFVVFCTYQLLILKGMFSAHPDGLEVVSVFAPTIIISVIIFWRTRYRVPFFIIVLLLCVGLLRYQYFFARYMDDIYLFQRMALCMFMGLTFSVSLLPGRIPLVSMVAKMVHGSLSKRLARYTRQVTLVWVFIFVLMAVLPLLVLLLVPQTMIFLVINCISILLLVLMVSIEYFVRCRLIPEEERSGMLKSILAYFQHSDQKVKTAPIPGGFVSDLSASSDIEDL